VSDPLIKELSLNVLSTLYYEYIILSTLLDDKDIDGIIHNVILRKIIIRRFLKYFRRKYRWRKKYWEYFDIEKNFNLLNKKRNMR